MKMTKSSNVQTVNTREVIDQFGRKSHQFQCEKGVRSLTSTLLSGEMDSFLWKEV